ncbi:MAG: signal peptidase I, partial [Elusimicrobia bacterium]|nr:signal peptidase I [Elusimicrobiota bacterium]
AAYGLRLPGGRRLASRPPRRGDLLVFRFPSEDPSELHCTGRLYGKDFLKRVVGLPGDVVEVRDGQLLVDGRPPREPYVLHTALSVCARPPVDLSPRDYERTWLERRLDREVGEGIRDHFGPVTVPAGDTLVLGDNRDGSCDSRFWGPVPDRYVEGRAVAVYWPPWRVGFIR